MGRYLTVLAVLLAHASASSVVFAQSRGIANARNLVDNDWSGSFRWKGSEPLGYSQGGGYIQTSGITDHMLSLRPSEKWDSGTVWFIKLREMEYPRQEVVGEAYKGVYGIYLHSTDRDVLKIVVGFTKMYSATEVSSGRGWSLDWQVVPRFKPEGADLLLTLEDGDTVPADDLELSVDRGFYVDENGAETVRRADPNTFMERLVGEGQVMKLRYLQFTELGKTLYLERGDGLQQMMPNAPPTFRFRASMER